MDVSKERVIDVSMDEKPATVTLKAITEFEATSYMQEEEVTFLASLYGPSIETLQRHSRAPVDLVAVLDRSSSMKDKLPLVQQTLRFMIKQLKNKDHLGLVMYDQNVDVLLPLTNMDNEGKDRALFSIKSLTAGGQTNASGGLLQGLDMIRRRQKANDVATVLLFTDGLANLGLTKPAQIRKAVRGVLGQIDAVCSVFTFGYGDEPDPEYLREISEEANGVYYHIDSPDAIPLAFSDCLGGLLSVVAQNLVLTVEVCKGATLIDVKTNYKKETLIDGSSTRVTIDDIYSEEQKDILCVVKIPKLEAPQAKYDVLDFSLTFKNLLNQQQEFQRCVASICRPEVTPPRIVHPAIDKQRNRIMCASAMQDALIAGQQSNYNLASDVLRQAERYIHASSTARDGYCQSLIQQLREGQQDVNTQEQFKKTQSKLNTATSSHYQQRSTHRSNAYTTSCKRSMTAGYASFSATDES